MIIKSYMESVGKEIEIIMRKKGVSRYRISKDLGVAQESLLRSLKEDANPRWKTVKKVLDYLGYEIRFVKQKRRGR
jgi:probable addiction module antidote protein